MHSPATKVGFWGPGHELRDSLGSAESFFHSRSCRAPSSHSPSESPAPPPATHRPKLPVMGYEETKEPRTLATPEETRRGAGETMLCLCPHHDLLPSRPRGWTVPTQPCKSLLWKFLSCSKRLGRGQHAR